MTDAHEKDRRQGDQWMWKVGLVYFAWRVLVWSVVAYIVIHLFVKYW